MKSKVKTLFQNFSRSVVDPVLYLSVIGLVLAVSVIMSLEFFPKSINSIGTILNAVSNSAIIGNLPLLLCVGLAGGFANKQKANGALVGLLSYLMFIYVNNTYLTLNDLLVEDGAAGMGLFATGQAMVLGLQVTDVNVFGGVILGCITGYVYNKCLKIELPDILGIYRGPRFALLVMIPITIFGAILSAHFWPMVAGIIQMISSFIHASGSFGVFIYGFLNRALIPTGLHHFLWMPFNYTPLGGTEIIDGITYYGASNIFYAEMPLIANGTLTALDSSIRFGAFAFAKEFGAFGAMLAMIKCARPEHKKAVKSILIPAYVISCLSGITEVMDFIIVFASPWLWIAHGVLTGLSEAVLYMLGNQTYNIFGLIELLAINLPLPMTMKRLPLYFMVGIVFTIIWYFVYVFLIRRFHFNTPGSKSDWGENNTDVTIGVEEKTKENRHGVQDAKENAYILVKGLGGKDNVVSASCCMTRLRVIVKDIMLVDKNLLQQTEQKGIIISGSQVQIVIGVKVHNMLEQIQPLLNSVEE